MRRGFWVAVGILLSVFVLLQLSQDVSQVTASGTSQWSAGYTLEEVEDGRQFLNGHPCENKEVSTFSYYDGSTTIGTYLNRTPQVTLKTICGLYTDYGFSNGEYFAEDNQRASKFFSYWSTYKVQPSSLTVRASNYISYTHDNIYKDQTYVGVNGLGSGLKPLELFIKDQTEMANAFTYVDYADRDATGQSFTIQGFATSENGQFIAIANYYGIYVIDTFNDSISIVSEYGARRSDVSLAVANDGKTIVYVGSSVGLRGNSRGVMRLSLVDASGCGATVSINDFVSTDKLSAVGCIETDLMPTLESTYGVSLNETYYSYPTSVYMHPRERYTQFKLQIQPKGSTPSVKTLRLVPNNVPQANGYLAMGDSFSSGEGDLQGGEWYEPGTDEQGDDGTFAGRNLCHVSRRSYPYLIAKKLGFLPGGESVPVSPERDGEFHSVACSGAVIHNVVGGSLYGEDQSEGDSSAFTYRDNQYRFSDNFLLDNWQQGSASQNKSITGDFFAFGKERNFTPEIITLGIGGNDAGFGKKLIDCALPGTCPYAIKGSEESQAIALEIANLKYTLTEAYKKVEREAPESTQIFVHGYPVFITNSTCGNNIPFDSSEITFIRESIMYMNSIVQAAAQEAGVFYVDVSNALNGYELCSGAEQSDIMMNGVTAGDDISNYFLDKLTIICEFRSGCIGAESFHPNPAAHEQYAATIMAQTSNFTASMPNALASLIPLPQEYFGESTATKVKSMNLSRVRAQPLNFAIPQSNGMTVKQTDVDGVIELFSRSYAPNSLVEIIIHSEPISLGSFTVDDQGLLSTIVELPKNLEPGLHQIHMIGQDQYGQTIDSYTSLFISLEQNDVDGDGVLNDIDSCILTTNVAIDFDQDGIDDACDGEVFVAEGAVLGDSTDNLQKGLPSNETVAGTEAELANQQGQVLGANTTVLGAELSQTGQSLIIGTITGLLISISAIMISKKDLVYHYAESQKTHTKSKQS